VLLAIVGAGVAVEDAGPGVTMMLALGATHLFTPAGVLCPPPATGPAPLSGEKSVFAVASVACPFWDEVAAGLPIVWACTGPSFLPSLLPGLSTEGVTATGAALGRLGPPPSVSSDSEEGSFGAASCAFACCGVQRSS